MKLNAYTIFDSASGLYMRPFYTQSDGEAKRSFADISMDAEHPIGKHPEDYSLHRIGVFDDNTAKYVQEKNECLVTALESLAATRKIEPAALAAVEKAKKINGENEIPMSNEEILETIADAIK